MNTTMIIPDAIWKELGKHLLKDQDEHLAFLLAGHTIVDESHRFLVKEFIPIGDSQLEDGANWHGLSLKLETLLSVMNLATKSNLTLIEAHSHPFSESLVDFSGIDLKGQEEIFAYLQDITPGKNYAALVLGQKAVHGLVWVPGRKKPSPISSFKIVGEHFNLSLFSSYRQSVEISASAERLQKNIYHRQILAFGEIGQQRLRLTKVAVVGLGGLGSIVAQELAHLGVRNCILIDDDSIELTNLHRVIGSNENHVGTSKVELAGKLIKAVNKRANVKIVKGNVRSIAALEALKEADVIFGCVDTDSGRMILNEFALAYFTPYIDCGVGIAVQDGTITEAGGRVVVWVPGKPCLLCAREFNPRTAAEELESPQEREFRRLHGYVTGTNIPEPAVISLNGTVASLAVTEFLALVTGFRAARYYTYYDLLEERAGPRIVSHNSHCTACSLVALGDLANIERYSRQGLPTDLPKI